MIFPFRTITAPTSGFGLTVPSPFRASARARRMNLSSLERLFTPSMKFFPQ